MSLNVYKVLLRLFLFKPSVYHCAMIMAGFMLFVRLEQGTHKMQEFLMAPPELPVTLALTAAEPTQPSATTTIAPQLTQNTTPSAVREDQENSTYLLNASQEFDPLALDENQIRVLKALSQKHARNHEPPLIDSQDQIQEIGKNKLEQKLRTLQQMTEQLKTYQDLLTKQEKENIQHMAKIYENMKAEEAAARLGSMHDLIVPVMILKFMNQRKASDILAKMDIPTAEMITTEMLRAQPLTSPPNPS